jgi:hypothetical protein
VEASTLRERTGGNLCATAVVDPVHKFPAYENAALVTAEAYRTRMAGLAALPARSKIADHVATDSIDHAFFSARLTAEDGSR